MTNNSLKLVIPSDIHKESYIQMMEEWEAADEKIHPRVIVREGRTYEEWLEAIKEQTVKEKLPPGYVPADTYFLMDNHNRVLGAINIRHELNEWLLKYGGHIGYGVRPTERRKGYAKQILRLGLEKCNELQVTKVLLTCDKTNIASAKTIIANGGVLENELTKEDGTIEQRYWIDITEKKIP